MAQRDNLYRRPSGIYVLRITVPVRYFAPTGPYDYPHYPPCKCQSDYCYSLAHGGLSDYMLFRQTL
ncbi:hypothetical protein HV346_18280 [Enterobacter sp. RHBSTW-00994]|uniref:hypothetical protein n=1 Tax=Enterobacter sp. RHBSTW-00994 TaxID=2742676 RepID=UPI0015E9529E|nr:hypothetical protein [Enterobacter sp. RHBSTW-00994]QLR44493.1 hypothetical protein HV346_18280 [Enterobacter sp. RHBSTW-00994]